MQAEWTVGAVLLPLGSASSGASMMVQAPEMQKGTEQAGLGPQGLTLYRGEQKTSK